MIRKSLLERIYEAAHIQRWNDHIRPKGFTELDKQAHKMIISYVLAKYEESDHRVEVNWRRLIEGGLFEFFHRIVLTDIKPPIFHQLMQKHGEQLNRWVLDRLRNTLDEIKGGFFANFERYLLDPDYCPVEKKILKAAHYLATNWEFKLIYNLNSGLVGLDETKAKIENELEEHFDLAGVQKMWLGKRTYNFVDLVGQLRFQQRWAHSPRVPETSVMGHMLIVAMLAYFCSLELDACNARIRNNYLVGLFHDLPEVLTRDIISPIKRSVEGLEELIKQIERTQVEERILPLVPRSWHSELKYFVEDEFTSKVVRNGEVRRVRADEIGTLYNDGQFHPVDGEVIKACDELAAFIEASLSVSHGITSHHLEEGIRNIYGRYENRVLAGIDFGQIFDYFKPNS